MSAPAFTPGPWHVFASSYAAERHDSVEINDSGGLTVAWAQKFVPAFADNGEANARLIAAAPELFEALADLLCYHDVPGPVDAPLKPLMDAAFAALAKATGQ